MRDVTLLVAPNKITISANTANGQKFIRQRGGCAEIYPTYLDYLVAEMQVSNITYDELGMQ